MKKNSSKLSTRLKLIYICLLLLIGAPVLAQLAPAQILNDTKTFEVTACTPSKKNIVVAWMEKRPARKDNNSDAVDMRVAYKSSVNNGKDWTEKGIIDLPETFATGNPYVTNNSKGETYLVCMHIGKDFYSGNVSLYEFDFTKKKFDLKSVPFKSDNRLLDKPAIVSFGDEIHLVYMSYGKRLRNSVKYQMSKDKGMTWTEPITVFSDSTVAYLGPSITILKNNQVVISVGSYGGKSIYLAKKKIDTDKIAFESPIVVTKVSRKLGSAMTELSGDGERLMLTWQNCHQRNETWMSFSTDEGNTWADPHLVTATGNLLSAVFDKKGVMHCIYSDFGDQNFFVGYKSLNNKYEVLIEGYLIKPAPLATFDEYLGAFQKLLIRKNELFAFWIDYPNNSTLYYTKWKM
jgi:hypothetical protein